MYCNRCNFTTSHPAACDIYPISMCPQTRVIYISLTYKYGHYTAAATTRPRLFGLREPGRVSQRGRDSHENEVIKTIKARLIVSLPSRKLKQTNYGSPLSPLSRPLSRLLFALTPPLPLLRRPARPLAPARRVIVA